MAVALNVPAGYFSDPNDLQGLTELLHHALLRGNPSYSTFQKFLSENNGDIKSMILADRAYFCADASIHVFEDVLAGFAGFFLEPSFSCNSSETDTNSYINEKTSVLDNLQKYLTNKDHPYHKFRLGNLWLALESLKAKGSLDHMQEVAIKNFSSLRQSDSEMKHYPLLMSLYTDYTFQILVKVPSMDGSKALRVQ